MENLNTAQLQYKLTEEGVDPPIWEELSALWERSLVKCPFQAPVLLQFHSIVSEDRTLIFSSHKDGRMMAAAVLKLGHNGRLAFLSDLKTDVNRFVFDPEITDQQKEDLFRWIIRSIKARNWSWTLNNQPSWVEHLSLLERIAREEGLYCASLPHSACPVLEAETPKALFEKVNGLRELRYRVNRLRKDPNVRFEVFTDDQELSQWVTDFCDVHVLRWSGTSTPSHLKSEANRTFLQGCLKAWSDAGLLVRFSITAADQRIGFVVGLRGIETITHHSTTYHPEHARSSPGKALILLMAEWMSENGYRILDFGDGQEEYKYTVADQERPLKRIFISARSNFRFIISAEVIQRVRNAPRLYGFYQKHLKLRFSA